MPHDADTPDGRAPLGFGTRAIKAATRAPRVEQGPAAVPIYQSATFHARDVDDYAALISFGRPGYTYARIENPTADALAAAFAELHGAQAGFAFGSGMAAIHAALLSLVSAGDRIVCTRAVYGSTRALMDNVFARLGVQVVTRRPDRPGGRRDRAGLGPHAPALRRDHLQPHHRGRGPGPTGGAGPRPRGHGGRGQHLRLAVSLPAPGAGRRPRRRIRHQVAERPLRRHRRGRGRQPRAHRGRAPRQHRHGRHRGALQRLPRAARHPDAARAHGSTQHGRRARWPRTWRPTRPSGAWPGPGLPSHPQADVAPAAAPRRRRHAGHRPRQRGTWQLVSSTPCACRPSRPRWAASSPTPSIRPRPPTASSDQMQLAATGHPARAGAHLGRTRGHRRPPRGRGPGARRSHWDRPPRARMTFVRLQGMAWAMSLARVGRRLCSP